MNTNQSSILLLLLNEFETEMSSRREKYKGRLEKDKALNEVSSLKNKDGQEEIVRANKTTDYN